MHEQTFDAGAFERGVDAESGRIVLRLDGESAPFTVAAFDEHAAGPPAVLTR